MFFLLKAKKCISGISHSRCTYHTDKAFLLYVLVDDIVHKKRLSSLSIVKWVLIAFHRKVKQYMLSVCSSLQTLSGKLGKSHLSHWEGFFPVCISWWYSSQKEIKLTEHSEVSFNSLPQKSQTVYANCVQLFADISM